jgi:hypothetical protein
VAIVPAFVVTDLFLKFGCTPFQRSGLIVPRGWAKMAQEAQTWNSTVHTIVAALLSLTTRQCFGSTKRSAFDL